MLRVQPIVARLQADGLQQAAYENSRTHSATTSSV